MMVVKGGGKDQTNSHWSNLTLGSKNYFDVIYKLIRYTLHFNVNNVNNAKISFIILGPGEVFITLAKS